MKEEKEYIDTGICPKCGSDEDTIMYDEWLGRELRLCDKEGCNTFYEVTYRLEVKDIKIIDKK